MTCLSSVRRLGLLGAFLPVLALLGVLSGSLVSAQGTTTIDGGTWNFDTASTGNAVQINLTGIPPSGLGAADISVAFDSAVLQISACDTGDLDGACNPNAPSGPARAAGFKAPAITTEPAIIATLTFDCIGAGGTSSALTITVNELVDGTPGRPQAITATVQNGSVVCGVAATPTPSPTTTPVAVPATGSAPGDSAVTTDWVIVLGLSLLAAALGVGAFGVWRLRRRV